MTDKPKETNFFAEYAAKQGGNCKLFSSEFVPRFAVAAPVPDPYASSYGCQNDEFNGEEGDDCDEIEDGYEEQHDPHVALSGEWYENMAPAEEPSISDESDIYDAIADWEENTPLEELPDSSNVCTFWVRHECRIMNCRFLHQYYGVRCHHLGHCILQDDCPFVHTTVADQRLRWERRGSQLDIPPPSAFFTEDDEGQPIEKKKIPKKAPNKAEFPSLGAATVSESEEEQEEQIVPDLGDWDSPELGADIHVESTAEKFSLLELKRSFSWVPAAVVETIFVQSDRKMDVARDFLHAAYPKPEEPPRPVVLDNPSPVQHRVIDSVCERERDFAYDIGRTDDPTRVHKVQKNAEKVVTETLRAEAFMHAKMRNMHFRLATKAYMAGNGAVAKRHSELGKQHDRMMRDLNDSAAEQILKIRNPHFCSFRGTNENVLDLHGLTVREAIDFLTGVFINTKAPHDRTFYVICGSGHHNPDHKTPLADAIRQFFQDNEFLYSDCSADKRGGMLRVRIPRSSSW